MILRKGRWLFISTMKNATNTLYDLLARPEVGGVWAGNAGFHSIPARRHAPLHWTCCRNPYDRAVSIWASTCMRDENRKRYDAYQAIKKAGGVPECFDDFAKYVLDAQPVLRNPWLWRNQSDWQDQFICDKVIHVEHLKAEILEHLDFVLPVGPCRNPSPHYSWQTYYFNNMTKTLVQKWAGADFERFGYVH